MVLETKTCMEKQSKMTPTDRIKQEAEDYANSHINGRAQRDVWEIVFKAHEAGATATHERAQVLVDALSDIASGKVLPQFIASMALEQWKSGKGKEVGK
jgi:hypothetical protein